MRALALRKAEGEIRMPATLASRTVSSGHQMDVWPVLFFAVLTTAAVFIATAHHGERVDPVW